MKGLIRYTESGVHRRERNSECGVRSRYLYNTVYVWRMQRNGVDETGLIADNHAVAET